MGRMASQAWLWRESRMYTSLRQLGREALEASHLLAQRLWIPQGSPCELELREEGSAGQRKGEEERKGERGREKLYVTMASLQALRSGLRDTRIGCKGSYEGP